jgi:hypothetical protein
MVVTRSKDVVCSGVTVGVGPADDEWLHGSLELGSSAL